MSINQKPVLLLHIGTMKTGTKSIQNFMYNNQELLLSKGIIYDPPNTRRDHIQIFDKLMHESIENTLGLKQVCKEPYHEICDRSLQAEYEKISRCPIKINNNLVRRVVSSETLYVLTIYYIAQKFYGIELSKEDYELCKKYFLQHLKNMYSKFDVKIICYLRRQDLFFESNFAQWVKSMGTCPDFSFPSPDQINIFKDNEKISNIPEFSSFCKIWGLWGHYYSQIKQWSDVFGKENIIIRPYEHSQMQNGIVCDFIEHILDFDSSEAAQYKNVELNTRWCRDLLEYRIKLKESLYRNEFTQVAKNLGKSKENQTYFLSKARKYFLNYYDKENSLVAKEFLGRDDGVLFIDKPIFREDEYKGLTLDAAISIGRELLKARYEVVDETKIYKDKLMTLLKILKNTDKKILIYGFKGEMAENLFKILKSYKDIPICGVVDKSIQNNNIVFGDSLYNVYKHDDISLLQPDIIIIAAQYSGYEINYSLHKFNLAHTQIYPLYNCDHKIWSTVQTLKYDKE